MRTITRAILVTLVLAPPLVRPGPAGAQTPSPASAPTAVSAPTTAPDSTSQQPSASAPSATSTQSEERNLNELRNTVINLLQALVERGVITREQAEAMVKSAQEKAAAAASAAEQQQKAEANAVRVPYVPEIVKDEIAKEVATELGPSVKKEVVDQVSSKGSLYSVLPEWVQRMRWTGDIRVRGEADDFSRDNAQNVYLNYNTINSAGGISKAGDEALLNTIEDQNRLRLRARFGFDTDLGSGWSASLRLASGSTGQVVATTNQTLGTYGEGYTVTFSQAMLRWTGESSTGRQIFTGYAGRFENPWLSTDLIWYNDLTFEGVISNYRLNLSSDNDHRKDVFLTLGALPLTSFSPFDSDQTDQQKWLLAGQLGLDFTTENESRVRFGAAYYDYSHIVGQLNALDSTLYDWTAPAFVQKGNTMFQISNTLDPTVNLFALAADYRIVDLISVIDLHVLPRYSVGWVLEALKNVGYNSEEVSERFGSYVAARNKGYRADINFGSSIPPQFGAWRASVGYRYLERDAVLDAFNDEDFHLGGTDAKGYTLMFDFDFNPHVFLRLKYMAANSIDGPPLLIDVGQIDLNARF